MTITHFEVTPSGEFELETEASYFGGWPKLDGAVAMAFPVEGWRTGAAVLMRQEGGRVVADVYGAGADAQHAWHQAMSAVSIDVDGSGFSDVGLRDPVIGRLQKEYSHLRPVLFHSPYEAACAFLIGHRISIVQTRRIRQRLAEEVGAKIDVGATTLHAFPDPRALLRLESFPGLAAPKTERLHAIAQAALDGRLDRERLRALPEEDSLAQLRTLPGIGDFFAQGILMRGAGLVDAVTDDELTRRAVQLAYGLSKLPDRASLLGQATAWRPYRMWALVLLHVWLRQQPAVFSGRRPGRRAPDQPSARI